MLANQRAGNPNAVPLSAVTVAPEEPHRPFRFRVPPKLFVAHNIASAGVLHNVTTCLIAQAQALWITAYFDDKLDNLRARSGDTEHSDSCESSSTKPICMHSFQSAVLPLPLGHAIQSSRRILLRSSTSCLNI